MAGGAVQFSMERDLIVSFIHKKRFDASTFLNYPIIWFSMAEETAGIAVGKNIYTYQQEPYHTQKNFRTEFQLFTPKVI